MRYKKSITALFLVAIAGGGSWWTFFHESTPPPSQEPEIRHTYWHKNRAKEPVLKLAEETKDSDRPVRQAVFLNHSMLTSELDHSTGLWVVKEKELRKQLQLKKDQIEAAGLLMLDWEDFRYSQDWKARIVQMNKISAIVKSEFPSIVYGWYAIPNHTANHRGRLTETLEATSAIFEQLQTTTGKELEEYAKYVNKEFPDHKFFAYIDSRSRQGRLFTGKEIKAKLDEISKVLPNSHIVVRTGNGSSWEETAATLRFVRSYLAGEFTDLGSAIVPEKTMLAAGEVIEEDVFCAWDLDESGMVDTNDLLILFAHWGEHGPQEDFDNSGVVGAADLNILFVNWGACPEPVMNRPSRRIIGWSSLSHLNAQSPTEEDCLEAYQRLKKQTDRIARTVEVKIINHPDEVQLGWKFFNYNRYMNKIWKAHLDCLDLANAQDEPGG